MSMPITYTDLELPVIVPRGPLPTFLLIEVEGTHEQLPKLMARMLRLHGFEVKIEQPTQKEKAE